MSQSQVFWTEPLSLASTLPPWPLLQSCKATPQVQVTECSPESGKTKGYVFPRQPNLSLNPGFVPMSP